jgi:hypothetical protein
VPWRAQWCGWSQHPDGEFGCYLFRKAWDLGRVPESLPVRVSADQRYQLRVNGSLVGEGPAVGDLRHWRYESYDLAPWLRAGENVVEATVWWLGRYAPAAQATHRLAFLLEGEGLDTPEGWKVGPVPGRSFEMMHAEVGSFYIDVGPGETIDGAALEPQDWREPNTVGAALERGEWSGNSPWWLLPRPIPALARTAEAPMRTLRGPGGFRSEVAGPPWPLAPGQPLALDMGHLVHGRLEAVLRGPSGARVQAVYAEGPWAEGGKLHRDDIQHGRVTGYQDVFVLDGGERAYRPLWPRTWRYLELRSDQPAELCAFHSERLGYPYEVASRFECDVPLVEQIWEVGVRTLRLCAGETYFDCPYYEQLQYVGDTRIQALCHAYLSRDRRLARQAAWQYLWSQDETGMVASCYPARVRQVIPGFTLWWVVMLADRLMLDKEPPPREWIEGARRAVEGFERLAQMPEGRQQWPFMDWAPEWGAGIPPGGLSSPEHALLLELARDALARLEGGAPPGGAPSAAGPGEQAHALRAAVLRGRGLPNGPWPTEWPEGAPRCTPYFLYYSHLAQPQADYLSLLGPWEAMLERGLTTFAETAEPTRSDCHAWSAHPVLGLLQTVAGVASAAPGWARAEVAPRPGRLRAFRAVVAHPDGDLTVEHGPSGLTVESPVPFELHWQGKSARLPAGRHKAEASGG